MQKIDVDMMFTQTTAKKRDTEARRKRNNSHVKGVHPYRGHEGDRETGTVKTHIIIKMWALCAINSIKENIFGKLKGSTFEYDRPQR